MHSCTLRWRHNDHDGVSNHQPYHCLLNRLFRRKSKKTSKLRVTGLCVGNSSGPVNSPHKGPVTRKMFPFDDVIMKFAQWVKVIHHFLCAVVIKYHQMTLQGYTLQWCLIWGICCARRRYQGHGESNYIPRILWDVITCTCSWYLLPWWRHQMETFSTLLAICAGNSPVPDTKASDAELWCFLWSASE